MQQAETGSDVFTRLRGIANFCIQQPTPSSALITTGSLDISVCVFYMCATASSLGDMCFLFCFDFSFLHLWHVRSHQHPRPFFACGESSGEFPAVTSPGFLWTFYEEIRRIKSVETVERLTLRIRVQCMSDTGYTDRDIWNY